MDEQTTTWDPYDAAVLDDQRHAYDTARNRCPVAHSDVLGWSLFRHSDVAAAAADPGTFSSATKRLAIPNGMDPPGHTAYRDGLEPFFLPDRVAAFEPRSRQTVRGLLDRLAGRPEIEAIGDLVDPFAHQVLCAWMGWPVADWNRISDWTHGNQEAAFRRDREAGARLAREFADYVTAIIEVRRADGDTSPGDLMAELVHTTVHDQGLSNAQIVALLRTWTAGHGTVAAAMGIVIRHLAEHQELQARLRARPDLLDAAIWEILRADGPLVANTRTTTQPIDIDGQAIGDGERISLMWISANRDPAVFADPDRVVLDRERGQNLLFGTGIHRCLGERSALLNLRVGIEELLQRVAGFEIAASGSPIRSAYPSNGLSRLPLRLHPSAPT